MLPPCEHSVHYFEYKGLKGHTHLLGFSPMKGLCSKEESLRMWEDCYDTLILSTEHVSHCAVCKVAID